MGIDKDIKTKLAGLSKEERKLLKDFLKDDEDDDAVDNDLIDSILKLTARIDALEKSAGEEKKSAEKKSERKKGLLGLFD